MISLKASATCLLVLGVLSVGATVRAQQAKNEVTDIRAKAGTTRIHCIEFGRGIDIGGGSGPLRRLARATSGTYRYIDVTRFPR